MTIGIKVNGCKDIKIIDCGFSGLETGIDVSDSDDVHVDGAKFQNVATGLKARRVRGLKASNSTDTTNSDFRLIPTAQLVRWYIEYLKRRG